MIEQDTSNEHLKRVNIIGVPISATNLKSCVETIEENIGNIKGQYICVSNVHTTVMAHDNRDYYKIQASSFMSVPDGKPLSVIGKKYYPEMDRVTGLELMKAIFYKSAETGWSHYFYGNNLENLELFITNVKKEYPWLNISGYEPSVFRDLTETEEKELTDRINSTHADFLWVALGAPRQENFCYKMRGCINSLMIGVGGVFNIVAGIVPDAPKWMQKLSLEWFYRLVQEPRRLFKRYITTNSKFIWYLIFTRR